MFARIRTIALIMMCSALLAVGAFAQTSSTSGEINGSVTDSGGDALPGVTVTVTNVATGLTRTAYTESGGQYSISQLPPGTYRVTAELAGLGSAQRDNVRVLLGQAANVRVVLNPSLAEEITVTAETPLVDTTQSGANQAVTETEIEGLPILGRDFKDLVLLTPGTAPAFGGRVAMAGARGTALDINIDGANANSDFFAEERGGTEAPFVFSQAAIQEFQVIRTTFSAEYARGGGGTVNAITKSGSNDLEGQLFYFLRDEDWADARTIAGIEESTSARDVDQYGFAVGGPIMRDRLFFFVNGDFQDVGEERTTADIRNNAAFQALSPATQQAFISRMEGLTGISFSDEFVYPTRENQETLLAKIDWNIANNNHFNIRWNGSDFNNFPSESSGPLSNQGDEYNTVNSYVAQLDSVLTSSLYNFALLQYSLEERPINPLTTQVGQIGVTAGPGATFFFGQRDFLPNGTDEEKWEFKDTVSFMTGDHQVKFGGNYLTVDVVNLFARDRFGDFRFSSVDNFLAGRLASFEQGAGIGTGATEFDFEQWGLFVMDTWRPTSRFTLDYGIRYDYATMPKPFRNIYEATNPELIDNFQEDDDNFAPRVGFAYDLSGDGRSVIRGGVGRYYVSLPAILLAGALQQTAGIFNNYSFNCNNVECPTFPNLFTPQQLANFNPTAALDLAGISPDFESGESTRGSLGYERELFAGLSVELEGVYGIHENQQRFVNVNAVPTGIVFGNLPQYTVDTPNKPYPAFRNVRFNVSDAEGEYTSATIGFRKIPVGNGRLAWLAHYTWSESIDQDTNSRSSSTAFSYDPYNPELSEGPSDNDITHRVVASATYELPFGFMVSGIYNWRTGQPFTRGVFYSGGPGSLIGLTNIGVTPPVFVDSSGNIIDLVPASGSTPAEFAEYINSRGGTILGRNTENQPDFSNLDMRISKSFGLPAGLSIELIGEVFNVFNTANKFITATNQREFTITQAGSGANIRYNITRNPSYGVATGLDFNSPARQYQAAAKLRF